MNDVRYNDFISDETITNPAKYTRLLLMAHRTSALIKTSEALGFRSREVASVLIIDANIR
jgi:hypothetical protein